RAGQDRSACRRRDGDLYRPPGSVTLRSAATGDRGHDGDAVAGLDGGVLLLQMTDIFVVHVDVDEGAQCAIAAIEVAANIGMLGCQTGEGFADGAAANLDGGLAAGIGTQRGGNSDL